MLLRQYRKIDTNSWIKLLLTGVLTGVFIAFGNKATVLQAIIFIVFFLALGSLANLVFVERWTLRGANFRYFIFSVFLLLWSSRYPSFELLLWTLLIEFQWQSSENFRVQKNSSWLLHSASVSALVFLFSGANGLLFGVLSFALMMRAGSIQPVHVLRWLFGYLFIVGSAVLLSNHGVLHMDLSIEQQPISKLDLWFILPLFFLLLLTLGQVISSIRRGNQTNKVRAQSSILIVLFGLTAVVLGIHRQGIAMLIVALSYQGALRLSEQREKWYVELIALAFLAYHLLLLLNVIQSSYGG